MASRYLNNITINDAYTLPATDGTNGQGIVTDGAGNLSFQDLASATATSALSIILTVKNVSGGSLSSGTLVRVAPTATPPSGNVLEVDVADNSSSSTMPAIGIITDTIADQAEGSCVAFGRAAGFSTSGYTEGDPIWVGTNGAFTGTKPTGTALIQRVGQIIKVHATNGSIEIFGAGRSNDVPNIPQNQLWLGNSSGVATPTAHTVENISNVTVTSKTDGQALVWDAANNYWKNGNVASSGGGGSTLSIERDVFTATANQTAFVLTSTIQSIANTQVYIDGVYQSKDNYTTSGSTVTFSTGVPAGTIVEINHFISVYSKVHVDTFTGNNSNVDFTASKDVTDENVTQIYIDGVYQSKDNYTTSGTTITFSTAPPNGSAVEVVHFEEISYSAIASNQFTGTGSQANFTLTQAIDEDKSFVFVQGVYQEKSTYSISGTTLTFTTPPQNGYSIEVITIGTVSVVSDALYVDTFTGNGSTVDYTLSSTPANTDAVDVYLNGIYQNKSNFSVSGTTLTFSTAPTSGTAIEIKSTGAYIVSAGVNSINGQSGDITIPTGINWQTTPKTANFTAVAGQGYFVDTTSAAITVTLPSSPSTSDEVTIVDYAGTADTNNITITSSDNINGSSADVFIDYERGGVSMVYVDATQGWIAYNAANETATATVYPTLNIDYLIVAGGGAGGGSRGGNATISAGGGGAGGYKTATSYSLSVGTNYSITIGAGGSGNANAAGDNGSSSSFNSITATGGDGGGSSGGDSGDSPTNTGGTNYTAGAYWGAGGGAGTGSGQNGSNGASGTGGTGGDGYQSSITGTATYYGGGGGGGIYQNTAGSGGLGGGGNGLGTVGNGNAGTANTGGGGGGAGSAGGLGSSDYSGGAGGSGVVILRYPNTYTVTIGSGLTGSTATDGASKVTTFTAGTGTISFS